MAPGLNRNSWVSWACISIQSPQEPQEDRRDLASNRSSMPTVAGGIGISWPTFSLMSPVPTAHIVAFGKSSVSA